MFKSIFGRKDSTASTSSSQIVKQSDETLESGMRKIIACSTPDALHDLYLRFLLEKKTIQTLLIKKLFAWFLLCLDEDKSPARTKFLDKYNELRKTSSFARRVISPFLSEDNFAKRRISNVIIDAQQEWKLMIPEDELDFTDPEDQFKSASVEEKTASLILQAYCYAFFDNQDYSLMYRNLSSYGYDDDFALRVEMSAWPFVAEALRQGWESGKGSVFSLQTDESKIECAVNCSTLCKLYGEFVLEDLFKASISPQTIARMIPVVAKCFVLLENQNSEVFKVVLGKYLTLKDQAGSVLTGGFLGNSASTEFTYENIMTNFHAYKRDSELSFALRAFMECFPLQALEACSSTYRQIELKAAVNACRNKINTAVLQV